MSTARKTFAMFSDFLLVAVGALSALACFVSAFQITVDKERVALIGGFFVLLITIIYSVRRIKVRYIFMGTLLLAGIFFYLYHAEMIEQATYIFYRMVVIGAQELGRSTPSLPISLPAGWATADTTVFFLLLLFLIIAFLGWAVIRQRSFSFSFLCTLLLLAPPLFLTITPDWTALMAVLAFWAAMLFIGAARYFNARTDTMGIFAYIAALLLVLAVSAYIPEEDYDRDARINELRTQMDVWQLNNNLRVFDSFGGGKDKLDFSSTGDRIFNGTIMLTIRDAGRQSRYLRGRTGAVYTGTGWEQLASSAYNAIADEIGTPLQNLTGINPDDADISTIALSYQYANAETLYVPYVLASTPGELEDATFVNDTMIEKKRNYREVTLSAIDYLPAYRSAALGADLSGDVSGEFAAYTEFVYEHYLDVPENLREQFNANVELGITEPVDRSGPARSAVIDAVREYLHKEAQYTLSPGTLPKGDDFITYFLFENKQGYCIHFATAGAMLLRTYGIPARYAEGYVVRTNDFGIQDVADIPDKQAHAWVEVFFDGIGWLPIEMTPGGALDENEATNIFDTEQPRETPVLEEDATPEPTGATPAPNTADTATPMPGAVTGRPTGGDDGGHSADEPAEEAKTFTWLWYVLAAAAACGLFVLARHLAAQRRARAFSQENTNAAVIAIYQYVKKLERHGEKLPEGITALAQKAQFSQHTLTAEEAGRMHSFARKFRAEVMAQNSVFGKVYIYIRLL